MSESHMRQGMAYQLEDARSSLPPLMDNESPNPTVIDERTATNCETFVETEQMSCYNRVQDFDHKKEMNCVMSWINVQPAGMDMVPQVGGLSSLDNGLPKPYPGNEICEKSMSLSRQAGFNQQALMQSANMTTTTGFRVTSLRPKTEPLSFSEGEDEAQSTQKGCDYVNWPADLAGASLYQNDGTEGDSSSPLQSSTGGTDLSCLTGSLCSGENMSFDFKYRLQDITAPVDSGHGPEIIGWA